MPSLVMRFILTVLAAAAIAAGTTALPAHAQSQASSRERTLFVSALDAKGNPVDVLQPEDVIVRENGLRREVLSVSRAVDPLDIAVLVDNSQAASGAIVPLRQSLAAFVSGLEGQNIALFGLAARPTVIVDYTSNRARLADGIGRLFPQTSSGMTLMDAILEVSAGMRRRESARAVIVAVLTDGIDFSNRYFSRDVIAALEDADIAFHAVTIGTFPVRTDIDRERAIVLDKGAIVTGGQRMALLSQNGLDFSMRKLARELSSQFKVVYGRPESLIPPDRTEVTSSRSGLIVRGTPGRGQGV